jgi:hypothetical protein
MLLRQKRRRENCYRTLLFSDICQNKLFIMPFAKYHYDLMTHLPEHTVEPKTESLTLLFEMICFGENMPNFPFLAMRCLLIKTQLDSIFR